MASIDSTAEVVVFFFFEVIARFFYPKTSLSPYFLPCRPARRLVPPFCCSEGKRERKKERRRRREKRKRKEKEKKNERERALEKGKRNSK